MRRATIVTATLLSMMGCAAHAAPEGSDGKDDTATAASDLSATTPSAIAGTYMFHIATPRGPEVGNWSLHADGTLYTIANGAQIAAGTWTTNGTTITIVRNTPYGNHCTYAALRTPTGFASPAAPSAQITCTFNRLRPNQPTDWYMTRLP